MILSSEVRDGNWAGNVPAGGYGSMASTVTNMQVDYVRVYAGVPGDFNGNGVVDAADYALWRKGDLAADGNGDTLVNQADYDLWRSNFGNGGPGAGSGLSGAAVPEPTGLVLLALGLIGGYVCRRRTSET